MKAFIGGAVLGALLATAVFVALPRGTDEPASVPTDEEAPPEVAPEAAPTPQPVRRDRRRARVEQTERTPAAEPFEPGTAVLGIGAAYDFGAAAVRPTRAGADLVCLDIRHGVSLACGYGTAPADLPLDDTGLPRNPAEIAALVSDAPLDLPRREAQLPESLDARHPGVELIRSHSGRVYKVYLAKLSGDPDALERRVRIVFEEVPAVEGGGVVRAVVSAAPDGAPAKTRAAIERIIASGRALPGDSFSKHMRGTYSRVTDLPPALELNERSYLLLDEPLSTSVTIKRRGAVYATRGMTTNGTVTLDSYSGVAVEGELAGKVNVKSYAYVFSGGDVTGEVDLGSYATLVIDGDLRGTVKVRSYADVLLRGRILGTLDVEGSCWSTFYFETYMTRGQLESLPGDFHQITLHVRESDLAAGEHEKIGTWRKVIVGDPVWTKIAR